MQRRRSEADRRVRQADRLARVLRVLELIQGRGQWNIRELAAEQECSERTVHRDLGVLQMAGVPWLFDREETCYRVRPDFRFPVLNLTEDELLGQAVASVVSKAPGLRIGPGAVPTTQKIKRVSSESTRQLLQDAEHVMAVLGFKLPDHSRHHGIIRTVQWALIRKKQLAGQYRSPYQPGIHKLVLCPFRLAFIKAGWYLIAQPAGDQCPRTYRITRFKSLRMTDNPALVPDDFDLESYLGDAWGVYRGKITFDIELEFSSEAAEVVTETVWHHTQQVRRHKDGRVTLTFRVDGLNEIVRWVLGWAGRVKVIQPPELRDLVVKQFQQALTMNQP